MKHPEHNTTVHDDAILRAAAGETCEPSKVLKKLPELEGGLPFVRDRIEWMLANNQLKIEDDTYKAVDQDTIGFPVYAETDLAE